MAGGVGRHGITGRIARGQLNPLLSDVYLHGPREPAPLSFAMAVVLHLRGDAVISSDYATWIWGLTDGRPGTVAVTLSGRNAHPMAGATIHRVATLPRKDVRWRKGVPVTAPARSVIDFATRATLSQSESALAMFRRQDHQADQQLRATIARLPANHSGAVTIARLLELPRGQLAATRSRYERLLRALLRQARLPPPLSNQMVAGSERDLVWPEQRLIVEFDGWEFHKDKFLTDRARDAAAVAAGWRVIRLTADRLDTEPLAVIAELAGALALMLA